MFTLLTQIVGITYLIGFALGLVLTGMYWAMRPKPHVHDPADPVSVPMLLLLSFIWFVVPLALLHRRSLKLRSTFPTVLR